jgi:DNA-binding LacI/PurR family transcriptional regulator
MQPVASMTTEKLNSIADIARLAGVSKSTVSRALNDSPLIGVETKERIREIARAHGFQIDVRARRLSLQQSGTIAFVAYGYKQDTPDVAVQDSFMLGVMTGISAGLQVSDYDLLIIHVSAGDVEWPRRYLDAGRADGFILLHAQCSRQQMRALLDARAPFVLWGVPSPSNAYCSVVGDSLTGGRLATEHLLEGGRRRIAFLGGFEGEPEVESRFTGYRSALEAAGIPVAPELVAYGDYSEASGETVMAQLLDRAPDLDAVFVNSDVMAIGAIDTLRDRGRDVPADVAVVGYDDIPLASHINPPLTTIRQDATLAGQLLAETLIRHLRTGAITSVSIPAELIVRGSA